MITSDPLRTPNSILFGNPDYFLDNSPSCTNAGPPFKSCFSENRGFTDRRNTIASQMIDMLEDGAFNNQSIDENIPRLRTT